MPFADSRETAQKQGFSRKSAKESIMKSQVLGVKRSLKLQENVSLTNQPERKYLKPLVGRLRVFFSVRKAFSGSYSTDNENKKTVVDPESGKKLIYFSGQICNNDILYEITAAVQPCSPAVRQLPAAAELHEALSICLDCCK